LIEQARGALVDPDRGYFLVRGLYAAEELGAYRAECESFMRRAPRFHMRLNADWMFDYVHPYSLDVVERNHRLYQYLHNPHSPTASSIFERALALRNRIEEAWTADPAYRRERERQQDYVIVTRYLPGRGELPRHRDYRGPATFPLIQSLALLSRPREDFAGGELVLFGKAGRPVRLIEDLGAEVGDLLLFDKALEHEVQTTLPGRTDVSRWSVNVGARSPRDGYGKYVKMRLFYNAAVFPVWTSLVRGVRVALGRPPLRQRYQA
jgi:hypothetical protein